MAAWLAARSRSRSRVAGKLPPGGLRRFLETAPPARSTPVSELPLLAVDVETTGLDPRNDRVLAVGFVPVDGDRIVLGGAGSVVVRSTVDGDEADGVGQSATVHGITDDDVAEGMQVEQVLDLLFNALAGRVLLAHYSRIEIDFLGALCRNRYGVRPPMTAVDTLELQRRVMGAGIDMGFTADPHPEDLRLWGARARYGLPRYRAHDALIDAVACAELYLAQTAELGLRGARTLRDLRTA